MKRKRALFQCSPICSSPASLNSPVNLFQRIRESVTQGVAGKTAKGVVCRDRDYEVKKLTEIQVTVCATNWAFI